MSLITVAEVERAIDFEQEFSDAAETFIDELIENCLSEAETYLDLKLRSVSAEVVYLDGGEAILFLPHLNVSNVQIWEDDSLLDAEDYAVYGERGKIRRKNGEVFLEGELIIKVQYDGGYTTLPTDLKAKLIRQIAYSYRRRKDPGLSSVTYPDGTINKMEIDQWLPDVEKVLNSYRRLSL